jgi:hypothetical protein
MLTPSEPLKSMELGAPNVSHSRTHKRGQPSTQLDSLQLTPRKILKSVHATIDEDLSSQLSIHVTLPAAPLPTHTTNIEQIIDKVQQVVNQSTPQTASLQCPEQSLAVASRSAVVAVVSPDTSPKISKFGKRINPLKMSEKSQTSLMNELVPVLEEAAKTCLDPQRHRDALPIACEMMNMYNQKRQSEEQKRDAKLSELKIRASDPITQAIVTKFGQSSNNEPAQIMCAQLLQKGGFTRDQSNSLVFGVQEGEPEVIRPTLWRKAALETRIGASLSELKPEQTRQLYTMEVLLDAINFLLGPTITQKIAYGTHIVTRSNGIPELLPKNICKYTHEDAFTKYTQHRGDQPFLSRSLVEIILAIGSPGATKNMAALDSVYVTCGLENFKHWRTQTDEITLNRPALNNHLKNSINQIEYHMKEILPQQLTETSNCKFHSFAYLLDGEALPRGDVCCSGCGQITALIEDTRFAISTMRHRDGPPHKETGLLLDEAPAENKNGQKEHEDYFEHTLLKNFKQFWRHVIRTAFEKGTLPWIIDNLQHHQAAALMDFMQRLLGMEYRESQTAYFGKSGMPWLGTLFIRLKTESEKEKDKLKRESSKRNKTTIYEDTMCMIEIYDATSDTGKENGFFNASSLEAIVKLYKTHNPHITELILVSDGAGCYQGNHLLMYLPYMYTLTGKHTTITRHFIIFTHTTQAYASLTIISPRRDRESRSWTAISRGLRDFLRTVSDWARGGATSNPLGTR